MIGRGGIELSLYGGDTEADYDAVVRLVDGRRVDLSETARILIVLQPTEFVEHGACCQARASQGWSIHCGAPDPRQ